MGAATTRRECRWYPEEIKNRCPYGLQQTKGQGERVLREKCHLKQSDI